MKSTKLVGFGQNQGDRGSFRPPVEAQSVADLLPCGCAPSWPWIKWFEAFLIRVAIIMVGYFVILGLQQYEILEPCHWKISYHRECKVDTYIEDFLTYTTFQEDYFCIFPGITLHDVKKGWNMEQQCN